MDQAVPVLESEADPAGRSRRLRYRAPKDAAGGLPPAKEDYAGVAQALLGRRHPDATALLVAGAKPTQTGRGTRSCGAAWAASGRPGGGPESAVPVDGRWARYGAASLPFAPARGSGASGGSDTDVYPPPPRTLTALARDGRMHEDAPENGGGLALSEDFTLVRWRRGVAIRARLKGTTRAAGSGPGYTTTCADTCLAAGVEERRYEGGGA